MGGSEQITTEALRALARDLDEVVEALEAAGATIEAGEVGGSAFSLLGLDMAVAYPSAHAFGVRDAEHKATHVEGIQKRLGSTADTWDAAEQANTIQPGR